MEQLTYLLFLKMPDERAQPPHNQASIVPGAYSWPSLLAKDGDELFDHYRHVLEALGQFRLIASDLGAETAEEPSRSTPPPRPSPK